jgi:hypothetical protein
MHENCPKDTHNNAECTIRFVKKSGEIQAYLNFRNPTPDRAVASRQVRITGKGCRETNFPHLKGKTIIKN